jgi:hypothetical protein
MCVIGGFPLDSLASHTPRIVTEGLTNHVHLSLMCGEVFASLMIRAGDINDPSAWNNLTGFMVQGKFKSFEIKTKLVVGLSE